MEWPSYSAKQYHLIRGSSVVEYLLNRWLPSVISLSNQLLRVDTINYGSVSAFQHWCTLVGSKFFLRKTEAFLLGDRSSYMCCVRRNSRFCKTAGWTVQVKFKHNLFPTTVSWWRSNAIHDSVYACFSHVQGLYIMLWSRQIPFFACFWLYCCFEVRFGMRVVCRKYTFSASSSIRFSYIQLLTNGISLTNPVQWLTGQEGLQGTSTSPKRPNRKIKKHLFVWVLLCVVFLFCSFCVTEPLVLKFM